MDTIIIENLIYSGVHGVYEQEHITPQRFLVELKMDTETQKAGKSDNLFHTIDYKKIQESVQEIIEGEHHNLVESLAEDISTCILKHKDIQACEVSIKKLDAFDIGLPGVIIRRSQEKAFLLPIQQHESDQLIETIKKDGVAKLHLLSKNTLSRIKEELTNLPFHNAETYSGPYDIEQNFSYFRDFSKESILWKLSGELEQLLTKTNSTHPNLFSTPLSFNEISAQVYPIHLTGISPHKDESRFKNIIIICVIEGEGEFYVTSNREGDDKNIVTTKPGDILFMRAPGFNHENIRPVHGVQNITEERISLTLRQEG